MISWSRKTHRAASRRGASVCLLLVSLAAGAVELPLPPVFDRSSQALEVPVQWDAASGGFVLRFSSAAGVAVPENAYSTSTGWE